MHTFYRQLKISGIKKMCSRIVARFFNLIVVAQFLKDNVFYMSYVLLTEHLIY